FDLNGRIGSADSSLDQVQVVRALVEGVDAALGGIDQQALNLHFDSIDAVRLAELPRRHRQLLGLQVEAVTVAVDHPAVDRELHVLTGAQQSQNHVTVVGEIDRLRAIAVQQAQGAQVVDEQAAGIGRQGGIACQAGVQRLRRGTNG